MRASSFGLTLLVIAQTWVWGAVARAQPGDAESDRGEKSAADSSETIKRVEPDILFVKDAKGETVPLLNHTLEEIEKLLELRDGGVGAPRPSFRIDRLVVNGEAGPKYVSISIQFSIHASDKKWVRVPLRLGGLSLEQTAEHQGEGEQFLEYDETSREYVSWFRGETEKPHLLTLKALAPLEHAAGQTRLKLNVPRAVHSELTLKVPVAGAVGEVSSGAVLLPTQPQTGFTEFKAIGLTSDFALAWRENAAQALQAPAALDASGRILVQIDRQSVQTKATLLVKAFGREFDAFRVRLPAGAQLTPEEHADCTVVPLSDPSADLAAAAEPQWVEVRRKTRSAEQLEVQLTTRRVHEETAPGKPIELSGFEVLGASRQWGYIAVAADNHLQASFGKRNGVRQVEDLPENLRLDEGRSGDWVASFEYYRQPYSLPLFVSPRDTVISVDPTYVVQVGARRLQLDARLVYRVGGDKAFTLDINLPGWDVDVTSVGPSDYVDASRIVAKPGMPLSIPLKQAAFGKVELTLQARREVAADAGSIEFQLPRPVANTLGMTDLRVLAADNVELTPREAELAGLSRQPAGPTVSWPGLKLPPRPQDALYYRADSAEAKFAADFKVNPRRISVKALSSVQLDESGAQVKQTFSYQIAYEPAESLAFDIPRELVDQGKLEFLIDGKPAIWEPLGEKGAEAADETPARRLLRGRVRLPEPRIGVCDLKLDYSWNGKPLIQQATVPLTIPLAVPAEGECLENHLDLVVEPGVKAEKLSPEWSPRTNVDASDTVLHFSAVRPWPEITLSSTLADRPSGGTLIVERAWLQTSLTKERRTDLAVYRFESRDHRFSLILPQGSHAYEFLLDGEAIDSTPGQLPDERVIAWRETGALARPHVLEVRYSISGGGARNVMSLDLPKLGPGISARRTYWQLILPRDEYLVAGPAELTPETFWDWQGFYWARRPLLDEQFLEGWIFDQRYLADRGGSAPHYDPPSPATNQYLFSAAQIDGPAQVRVASRSLLVLIGSGLVLFCGLMLIYAPALRRPGLLFVAAVALFAAALIYPEATLLWLQAALLGGALTLLAALLERNVSRRRRRETLMRGGSSSIIARNSSRAQPRLSASSAPVSTETAAVAIELSAPESRP